MENIFADRISDVPRSFIREILKVTLDSSVISFAGGLPNRELFPLEEIKAATNKVFTEFGKEVLQYSSSEGDPQLRKWISNRYRDRHNIIVHPDNILITTGSQQGLDLLGKTFINEADNVIIEEPGYLGAIQAFSIYKSSFLPIPLETDGINIEKLENTILNKNVKLFYCVPNFQNPSGVSYSDENRKQVARILKGKKTILVEDDPYGELRFLGNEKSSFYKLIEENTILLGSFSKIIVPSLRIGWMVARDEIMEKLIIAKQASDLHTNYLGQRIILQYLKDNNIDDHVEKIKKAYGAQRQVMLDAIMRYFPGGIKFTQPEGGMFLWITLPEKLSALEVFEKAILEKVAFVPGDPFYVNRKNVNTLRLNFSNADSESIDTGMKRLGAVLKDMI